MLVGKLKMLIFYAAISLLLAGCNFPLFNPEAQNPGGIYTQAAQTVIAQATLAASPRPTITFAPPPASPTITEGPPTAAFSPSPAPGVTLSPSPDPTQPDLCDRADFVEDVTIPDNTEIPPEQAFIKTWRLRNSGTCTWTDGYTLVFAGGEQMDGPDSQRLTNISVRPGEVIEVSVELRAPAELAAYQGDWKLRNLDGREFGVGSAGDKTFWVRIRVTNPSGIALDMISRASSAEWLANRSGQFERLTFGGESNNPDGFAAILDLVRQEDGRDSPKILATFPPNIVDGEIRGIFPEYTVQNGDRLRGRVGFLAEPDGSCGLGRVVFRIGYLDDSRVRELWRLEKTCNERLEAFDIDLSNLRGETIRFVLLVEGGDAHQGDRVFWSSARIER